MKLSVLIPCYNAERYLGEALESVLVQRVPLHEVIVVDDGSTDGSALIAAQFGHRVRCVGQANQGMSGARNRALLEAGNVDLIAFLDADDLWPEGSLAHRIETLERDDALDGVAGLVEEFVSPELDGAARRALPEPAKPQLAWLLGAALFRRRVFDRIGRFDESYAVAEGIGWLARARIGGIRTQEVHHVVLRRRLHLSNTGLRFRQDRREYLRVLKASLDQRRQAVPVVE